MRIVNDERNTLETKISLELNLDENTQTQIDTGIGFFDHMLNLFSFHGQIGLKLRCEGDLYIDEHHSVEDIGLIMGKAFKKALGDKLGIKRYSNVFIPMDEALAQVSVDISSRPYLVWNVDIQREKIGNMDTQSFKEFFKSFVNESSITLHINLLYGENEHHKIEAIFKAFGRALKEAIVVEGNQVSSSKGVL